LKLKFLVSNLGGGERQLGSKNFKQAKKSPKQSKKTASGNKAGYIILIEGMFFTVLFNFSNLTLKAALVMTTMFYI
jgi:hypothetical protein